MTHIPTPRCPYPIGKRYACENENFMLFFSFATSSPFLPQVIALSYQGKTISSDFTGKPVHLHPLCMPLLQPVIGREFRFLRFGSQFRLGFSSPDRCASRTDNGVSSLIFLPGFDPSRVRPFGHIQSIEHRCRFFNFLCGDIRVSHHVAIFDVRCFRSMQEFNGNDCGPTALVLRGACTKTSWLSSARSSQLQQGTNDSGASPACSGDISGHSVVLEYRCTPSIRSYLSQKWIFLERLGK